MTDPFSGSSLVINRVPHRYIGPVGHGRCIQVQDTYDTVVV